METRADGEERMVELKHIMVDPELQMRMLLHLGMQATFDPDIVVEYQEAIVGGSDLGRLALLEEQDDVGRPTGVMLLVDGFHRLEAMRRLGQTQVTAVVYSGTRHDGVILACELNTKRGLSYKPAEKQTVARRYLEALWAKGLHLADNEVARRLGFSRSTISRAREELAHLGIHPVGPRTVERGGIVYTMEPRGSDGDWRVRLANPDPDLDIDNELASRPSPQPPLRNTNGALAQRSGAGPRSTEVRHQPAPTQTHERPRLFPRDAPDGTRLLSIAVHWQYVDASGERQAGQTAIEHLATLPPVVRARLRAVLAQLE